MSLKLKAKKVLFKILNNLPEEVGDCLYHKIQESFRNNDIHYKIKSCHNSYLTFDRLIKNLGISINNKNIVEIGSGWLPIMPYFFKYIGKAATVETFDLYRHYNKKKINDLNIQFCNLFKIPIEIAHNRDFNLPEGISYYPKTDISESPIKNTDLVFSRFVLEHIGPQDIQKIHQKFIKEIPQAYIVHLISPSDHRAYQDKNLSNQDFLRYNEKEWEKKQTRFDYHNRLRLPQYLKIFKDLGYEILFLEYESTIKDSEAYKKFKNVPIHENFQQYSDDQLTAGSINIVLKLKRNNELST